MPKPTSPIPAPPVDPGTSDVPAERAAWALLLFLTLLNILNFVDRTLIASLGPLLIADLGLSRTELGLLAGFGFVLFTPWSGSFSGSPPTAGRDSGCSPAASRCGAR